MICDIVINEDERKKCSVLAVIDEGKNKVLEVIDEEKTRWECVCEKKARKRSS